MEKKIIEQNRNVLRNGYYDKLNTFFKTVWESSEYHDFIVMNSRRAMTLNTIFETVEGKQCDKVVSNEGLLFRIDDILDFYGKHNSFPRILIVDDILLYGRSVYNLISKLEQLILEHLEVTSIEEQYSLVKKLSEAIDIQVLTASEQAELMNTVYLDKLISKYCKPNKEIRELYHQVYDFINRTNIPLESYYLNYKVDELKDPNSEWTRKTWKYKLDELQLFFRKDSKVNFIPIIWAKNHPDALGKHQNPTPIITSQVLFGEIPVDDFNKLCIEVADILKFKEFDTILKSNISSMKSIKEQIINFLLSLINLTQFLDGEFDIEKSNLKDVMRYFGNKNNLLVDITDLINQSDKLETLRKTLEQGLISGSLLKRESIVTSSQHIDEVNYELESKVWECSIDSNAVARELLITNRPIASVPEKGYLDLSSIINHGEKSSDYISSLLALYSRGLLNIKFVSDPNLVKLCIKDDKMASEVMPKRLRPFVPALSLIEKDCWRLNLDELKALKSYLLFMSKHASEIPEENIKVYETLETQGNEIIDCMKNAGQTFGSWDYNLMTTEEILELYPGEDFFEGALNEMEIQENQIEMAKKFLKYH